MTDEQVGAESDQLPEDEGHDEIIREHDASHREHEKRQAGEVACLGIIVLHVGQREDVDQHADAGDNDHHPGGKAVELDADLDREISNRRPWK